MLYKREKGEERRMYDYTVIVEAYAEVLSYVTPIVAIFAISALSLRLIYQAINGGKIK